MQVFGQGEKCFYVCNHSFVLFWPPTSTGEGELEEVNLYRCIKVIQIYKSNNRQTDDFREIECIYEGFFIHVHAYNLALSKFNAYLAESKVRLCSQPRICFYASPIDGASKVHTIILIIQSLTKVSYGRCRQTIVQASALVQCQALFTCTSDVQ